MSGSIHRISRAHRRQHRNRRLAIVIILVAVCMGSALWLIIRTSTSSWRETTCSIVGSRVVLITARGGVYGAPVLMYQGEFKLSYNVMGQSYFVWADAGWTDLDPDSVRNRISVLPDVCDYEVRYNPRRPEQAIAERK